MWQAPNSPKHRAQALWLVIHVLTDEESPHFFVRLVQTPTRGYPISMTTAWEVMSYVKTPVFWMHDEHGGLAWEALKRSLSRNCNCEEQRVETDPMWQGTWPVTDGKGLGSDFQVMYKLLP